MFLLVKHLSMPSFIRVGFNLCPWEEVECMEINKRAGKYKGFLRRTRSSEVQSTIFIVALCGGVRGNKDVPIDYLYCIKPLSWASLQSSLTLS